MLFIGLASLLDKLHPAPDNISAVYLVFPLQTVVCAVLLGYFWREYHFALPSGAGFAAVIGLVVFGLWIFPQVVLHADARLAGFDPDVFATHPRLYWSELILRFLRLVIVVPLLEEIFWRGFLLRYLEHEDFQATPFGIYSARANIIVAIAFMLEHSYADWPAALAAGFLYNIVAYRTRSLCSCVLAHALTNGLLGAYIMGTRQWGFW
jgi:hypothetical protein